MSVGLSARSRSLDQSSIFVEDRSISTSAQIVVPLAAAWIGFSAYSLLAGKAFVVDNLVDNGVPRTWWPWLGIAKALGAVGLVVGLAVPAIGITAAVGLVAYFLGAMVTIVRAGVPSHLPFPLLYLLPAAAGGWLLAAG